MPYSVDFLSIFAVFNLYELFRAVSKKKSKVKVSAKAQGEENEVSPHIATADIHFTILLLNLTFDVLITFIILFLFLIPDYFYFVLLS